ncbi:GNAT family N-acetyltransferase [Actinoalloteichus hymeniacidonis]|uniref:Acetyltransferase n=1 Tax=Actinoalloteichus hymeniacidonis TaxID=340345 RepID=A0AAC9MVA1_9PSEU|nr:GNAT family N-acetyltransferase [Actinoalloteichus hymeniacidonis]AOS61018.1 acetyltransferase [Actinoalloteichus hymeniacidonis]MBB5910982.1 GNAT superfamily N-acetyltransferase [Actinoalloteichus hymeniacidonis]
MRPRRESDLDDCVSVLAAVHAADGYPRHWPANPTEWLRDPGAMLGAWIVAEAGVLLGQVGLIEAESEIAGQAWRRHAGPQAAAPAGITRLFVAPSARGRGIGTLLLDAACAEARRRDRHPVLDVLARDRAALQLYSRRGFRRLDTVDLILAAGVVEPAHCLAAPN